MTVRIRDHLGRFTAAPVAGHIYDEDHGWAPIAEPDTAVTVVDTMTGQQLTVHQVTAEIARQDAHVPPVGWVPIRVDEPTPVFDTVDRAWRAAVGLSYAAYVAASRADHGSYLPEARRG
ncbi:MAG: hypothetical protein ACRD0W_21065 [Acidimicrobiales bacterium]